MNIFKKRWPSQLIYFRNYGLGKLGLDKCLKSPVSGHPSKSSMVNEPSHCGNLNHSTFSIFIDQCEGNLSWKKSLLLISKIFGHFVNTLTAGHKFSLLNRGKLTQPIQMELSEKQKAFSEYFPAFLKCR